MESKTAPKNGQHRSPFLVVAETSYKSFRLKPNRDAAQHSLWRIDDHQFVIYRVLVQRLFEEVADSNEHFPLSARKVQERQGLIDLNIEAHASVRRRLAETSRRVSGVHLVDHEQTRCRSGKDTLERRGHVVNRLIGATQRGRQHS